MTEIDLHAMSLHRSDKLDSVMCEPGVIAGIAALSSERALIVGDL